MSGLEVSGLDELQENIKAAINEYPKTTEKYLTKAGNKLKNIVKEATPTKTGKLKKAWKSKVVGFTSAELEYQLRNNEAYYHLVERGHVIKSPFTGKIKGYCQGKRFFDKSSKEFEASKFSEQCFEKLIDDVKKKIEK